ncbi:MAG: endopeptidase La [Lachnospiraceae bacterium]|nr:endopeptidase La [Lachnospiraceae bacterium]
MSEDRLIMPVVAIRGITMLPGMMIHFDIHKESSIRAIKVALHEGKQILVVTQKENEAEEPDYADLFPMGTISQVKQMIKMPGNQIRVLATGIRRGYLEELVATEPYLLGAVNMPIEVNADVLTAIEQRAMLRGLKDMLEAYVRTNEKFGKDIVKQLMAADSLDSLINQVAVSVPMTVTSKQKILDATHIVERYEAIMIILANEIEILRIKKELQSKVKEKVDKNQKDYIMREQLKVIREELGEGNALEDAEEFYQKLKALQASDEVKDKIKKEIDRFKSVSGSQSEVAVARGYVETLLALPWDKATKDDLAIARARKILDKDHYGLEKVKERILEFLSVRALNEKGQAPIICLVGPPGTGKTSVARSVATALKKEYVRICLGGVRDEAEIRGHRRTYVGAMPGRLIQGLKSAKVKNPLMLLDEIDKVSSDYKGDTASALLEVLDPEQNKNFVDHYVEIPVDLSEVLFICTANTTQTIPKPLLDRMEIIEVNSYTENEKLHIAKEHLVPKQLVKNGLTQKDVKFGQDALKDIISFYTREAGVRSLERKIGEVCRKAAMRVLEARQNQTETETIKVTKKNLTEFLGKKKYRRTSANEKAEIGIVRGLAWTEAGGDTLQIEVNSMPGKGALMLTGKLGDVMKESAQIALSFVRSISEKAGVSADYFETHDFHLHVPEGAVPKDGPSAGITMATAFYSAVTDVPVESLVAMTGEISLRGRVLAIGGLKEKLLAAKQAGIKKVLVPKENESDLSEISEEILNGLTVVTVSNMEEVLRHALKQNECK